MSLRTKFILFFTILFASLATVATIYFEYSVRKSFREQILNSLRVVAEENESTYFAFIGQLKTLTINWSSDNYIKELAEPIVDPSLAPAVRAKAANDLGIYLRDKKMLYNRSVIGVDILDKQGIVVASNRSDRIGTDEGKKEREHGAHYFSKTIDAGFGEAFVRSIVFEEDGATEPMFHVTTRLFSTKLDAEGKFIPLPAVLLVHFDSLPHLSDLLRGTNEPTAGRLSDEGFAYSFETSDVYVINRDRLLVTARRFEPNVTYTTHVSTIPVEECFQNSKEMIGEYLNYRGVPVFGVSMCIPADGLVIIKEIDVEESYDLFFNVLQQQSIFLGTSAFTIIILAIFFSARRLLRRITMITQAAKKVTNGDFLVHIPYQGNDEIGMLAHSFNTMTGKLHDLYQNLELKVARRTRLLNLNKAKDEALLEGIGEGIIASDEHSKVTKVNRAAERMFGWKESELLGKVFSEIVHAYNEKGELIPTKECPVFTALTHGTPATLLASLARKDGTRFPASTIVAAVTINGEFIGTIAAIRDITKEKEVEKMRLDLLSLASHQLRTPLSGTKWLIETLSKGIHGTLNKEQSEYIEEIYKINERMTGLVSDMLSALRIESGMEAFQTEEVSVSSLFDALSSTMAPAAQAKQMFLRFNMQESATFTTARELLRNILEAFISNAIVYSPAGTEIFVDVKNNPTSVTFSVTDHGIGIPKSEQAGIFSRFYRASNARTVNTRGSGLGLYIASMLAEKIGAKVYFVSEEGKGTTFYVWIPKEIERNSSGM